MYEKIDDIIDYDLRILFCGINPGLLSAQTGHHFARPGNKFWKALYLGGLTKRILLPSEGKILLSHKLGIVNFVDRPSATAAELSNEEILQGAEQLKEKVMQYKPKVLAALGIGTYKTGFLKPNALIGLQPETIGQTQIWVLPNPSGLNAHYSADKIGILLKQMSESIQD